MVMVIQTAIQMVSQMDMQMFTPMDLLMVTQTAIPKATRIIIPMVTTPTEWRLRMEPFTQTGMGMVSSTILMLQTGRATELIWRTATAMVTETSTRTMKNKAVEMATVSVLEAVTIMLMATKTKVQCS